MENNKDKKDIRGSLIRIAVAFAIGIAFFLVIIFSKGIINPESQKDMYKILVDGLFVPGIVLLGAGLLVFVTDGGAFDMLAYGIIKLIDVFRKDYENRKYKTFYDYKASKEGEHHHRWYLILTSLPFIVVSLILLIPYYN
ncbi:MAG: DUF3899 domain-containing protein [Bacilli bacterium]|nr:DUF3899 domain-containing protein [Bacilli bacterium]